MSLKNLTYRIGFFIFAFFLLGIHFVANGQTNDEYKILTVPDSVSAISFYPFGGYLIDGEKPAPVADFYSFSLENTEQKSAPNEINIVGAVMTGAGEKGTIFRMEKVVLTGKTLYFQTETINNTHYEFDGRYTKKGDLRRFYKNHTVVLRGKFTKFVNGEPSASANIGFYFKVWEAETYYQPKR